MLTFLIPTLNEEHWLPACMSSIHAACQTIGVAYEIIVCDGGSIDGTTGLARDYGVTVVEAPAGRANQVNRGFETSSGNLIVMLHADSLLLPGAVSAMQKAVNTGHIGGFFQVCIQPELGVDPNLLRVISWGMNARTRGFRTATADQCIFATRQAWRQTNGVPDIPLMEGNAWVRALRSHGPLAVLPPLVRISGRRWEREGVIKTWVKAYGIRVAYMAGVSPDVLFSWWS